MRRAGFGAPHQLFADCAIATAEHVGPADAALLHPAEAALVAGAVEKRRHEFAAGRLCAHRALARLGARGACADAGHGGRARRMASGRAPTAPVGADAPIGRGAHGAPCWPAGIVGSISHARGRAVCAVAPAHAVAGIGIDIEAIAPSFPAGVLARIAVPGETSGWDALAPAEASLHAFALFSVKEAIYKCAFVADGVRLGFADVRVRLDLAAGWFIAYGQGPSIPGRAAVWTGAVGCDATHVFAGLWCVRAPSHRACSTPSTQENSA